MVTHNHLNAFGPCIPQAVNGGCFQLRFDFKFRRPEQCFDGERSGHWY